MLSNLGNILLFISTLLSLSIIFLCLGRFITQTVRDDMSLLQKSDKF